MGSRPRSSITMSMRRARRRSTTHRRLCKPHKSSRSSNGGSVRPRACSRVSEKLEALKNLIPCHNGNIIKADQLFQETANYIVLLKSQVTILQKLIDVYGSNSSGQVQENQHVVV